MKQSKARLILSVLLAFVLGYSSSNIINVSLLNKIPVDAEKYKKFQELGVLRDAIHQQYYKPVDDQDLETGVKEGLFSGLEDPYSEFLTKEEMEQMKEMTTGKFIGIGVQIESKDGYVTVVSPLEGSPAEAVGIRAGDRIVSIDGLAYTGDQLQEAVSKIKLNAKSSSIYSKDGTKTYPSVKLLILNQNGEQKEMQVERKEIEIDTVKSEMKGSIGYVRITNFDMRTNEEFVKALDRIRAQNASGLIIDLRNNPGGLLDQVNAVASHLLAKDQVIVYTEDNQQKKTYFNSTGEGLWEKPIVVLINKGSASASEILAAALKDHQKATLIGQTSFGKGLVQHVIPLADGTGYKLTTQQYFSPNGTVIQDVGVVPHEEIEMNPDVVFNSAQDTQLQQAQKVLEDQ